MTKEEAYCILDLDNHASPEEIKARYRELAQLLHPDKQSLSKDDKNLAQQQLAQQQFMRLTQAKDLLLQESKEASSNSTEEKQRAQVLKTARLACIEEKNALQEQFRSGILMLVPGLLFISVQHLIMRVLAGFFIIMGISKIVRSKRKLQQVEANLTTIETQMKREGLL